MRFKLFLLIIIALLWFKITPAITNGMIVVAQDGSGDFKTLTEATASLPMFNYGRVVIYIKNGVYNEKIRIEQDNVTLRGEDRTKTIIEYSQLREDWIKNPDATGPAVINLYGDDIIIENMTIENTQPEIGPHAFSIYGECTRTIILNCNVISKGGDTISLWDYKTGMYYHANSYFEGAVDFVCPRGWCFIKDSEFYEVKKTAALWHAGGFDKNQKFVIKNSRINGIKGFELARHHYEAQFYFIECSFSDSMSSKPIYRVTYPGEPQKDRTFIWGERYYFYDCVKEGEPLEWMKNNLSEAEGSLSSEEITAEWTFDGKWNPEGEDGPVIISYNISGDTLLLTFNENISVWGIPELISENGTVFKFLSGGENQSMSFAGDKTLSSEDIRGLRVRNDVKLFGTIASVKMREAMLEVKGR